MSVSSLCHISGRKKKKEDPEAQVVGIRRSILERHFVGRIGHPWPGEGSKKQRRVDENYNMVTSKTGDVGALRAKEPRMRIHAEKALASLLGTCP